MSASRLTSSPPWASPAGSPSTSPRTSGCACGWGHGRPAATVVLLALVPVATLVPGVVALALVALTCVALVAYEALRYPYARSWIRSHRGSFTTEEVQQIAPRRGRNVEDQPT
jgi:hypothetical protein